MTAVTPQQPRATTSSAPHVSSRSHALPTSLVPNADWSDHRRRDANLSVETLRFDATCATVRVAGELDLGTAAPLWAVLRSHITAGRRFLRLDVGELTFVDATALSGITAIHHDLLTLRGTLVVVGVRSLVARVLHLTGLDEVLFVGGPRTGLDVAPFDPSA